MKKIKELYHTRRSKEGAKKKFALWRSREQWKRSDTICEARKHMSFAHAAMTHQSCCRWTLLRSITAGRWTAARGLSCCRCYHPSNKSAAGLWIAGTMSCMRLPPRTLLEPIKYASTTRQSCPVLSCWNIV